MIEAFFSSTAIVALAEIGDKTQLLAILLATRLRAPLQIALGILVATLANHFLAAWLGAQAGALLDSDGFRYAVAAGFVAMGLWTLIPDKFDENEAPARRGSAFMTTLVAFFLVEIGDKTQIATIALGARYGDAVAVTAGTTLGMMLANLPAIWLGETLVRRIPLTTIRFAAAALLIAMGLLLAAQTAGLFG